MSFRFLEVALAAHPTRPGQGPGDAIPTRTARDLSETFGIHHSTIQIERDPRDCP